MWLSLNDFAQSPSSSGEVSALASPGVEVPLQAQTPSVTAPGADCFVAWLKMESLLS